MSESWIEIKRSRISGLGAFARNMIPKGTRIIEYRGERVSPQEADRRYADVPAKHPHVLLFSIDARTVIDAGVGGNQARFINHSCAPNCESITHNRRVWIHALRDIKAGEELTYDYNLTGDPEGLDMQRRLYPCRCGATNCRGTLFKPA